MQKRFVVVFALLCVTSCHSNEPVRRVQSVPSPSPSPSVTWSSTSLTELLSDQKDIKRAWTDFERSQKYRLAQPSDRNLTRAAAERVMSNNPQQILPYLTWWGAEGYKGRTDFLIAIVVDPSRTDANRYGLVVIAAPQGARYKTYWVAREEDMESYLLSPSSGSVFIECFRRDGTNETKELAWYRSAGRFRLK